MHSHRYPLIFTFSFHQMVYGKLCHSNPCVRAAVSLKKNKHQNNQTKNLQQPPKETNRQKQNNKPPTQQPASQQQQQNNSKPNNKQKPPKAHNTHHNRNPRLAKSISGVQREINTGLFSDNIELKFQGTKKLSL